jgi:hypothetical protein
MTAATLRRTRTPARTAATALVAFCLALAAPALDAQRDTAFTFYIVQFEEELSGLARQLNALEARIDQAALNGRTAIANCDEPGVLRAIAELREVEAARAALEAAVAGLRGRMLQNVRDMFDVLSRVSQVESVDADTDFRSLLGAGRGQDLARVADDLAGSRTVRVGAGVAPERRAEVTALARAIGRQVAAIDAADRLANNLRAATLGERIASAILRLETDWAARKPTCGEGEPAPTSGLSTGGDSALPTAPGATAEQRADALARLVNDLYARL